MNTFQIIQLVLSVITAGAQGIAGIVDAAHQNGELTDDERATLLKQADEAFAAQRWQPDQPLPGTGGGEVVTGGEIASGGGSDPSGSGEPGSSASGEPGSGG